VRSSWRERRRWSQARFGQRLESLPPFWTVFALTLTEMVGAAILALPTAVAGVGPLVGVGLLVVLGLVNIVTIAALSEAFIRDGNVRYGHVYFGRLVANYLGGGTSSRITRALLGLISLLLMADCVGSLLVYSIGVSTTLAAASGVSALLWVVLLLGIVLYFLRRQTLDLTIASALMIGGINIGLLILLALLVLPHVSTAHLLSVNLASTGAGPFEPSVLGLIFGVIMAAYFGHFSTGTCARLVLSRDPSGRSLVLGNVAAMCVAIVLNCVWVIAVNGTLAPSVLVQESGTAIHLLASEVGPIVNVIGVLFVILGMGMGAIHAALALMYQMREWLAAGSRRRSPFLAGAVPVVAVFGLAAWLLTAEASFAGPLGVLGVVAYSVLGGTLPALLLLASRRKGDFVPAVAWRVIGHPVVLIGVYALFLASFFVHGLVIWSDPFERLAALAVGTALLALTGVVIWRGALTPRVVVEVRIEHDQLRVSVTDCGRAGAANIQLGRRAAVVELPATLARQLKVWTHQVTPTGDSDGLPARVEVVDAAGSRLLPADGRTGQTLGALSGVPYRVSIGQ
jgi:amino acid permease